MKMHKTILTLLAVMLAVIGTTGTVINAQGNDSEPDPSDYLNSTQLSDFNSLRDDVKNGLTEGFLPDLVSQQELTEQDKKNFFAAVVEMEKNAPAPGEHFHARDETDQHSHCSDPLNVTFSVGSQVGAFASASCVRTIDAFHAWVKIFGGPTGYAYASHLYHNATYAYSWTYADYQANTQYKYCGGFFASVNDLPTPTPTRQEICVWHNT